jgi:hypothetical protein
VKISSSLQSGAASQNNGLPVVPIVAVIVILAIFIGGWIVYLKKIKK